MISARTFDKKYLRNFLSHPFLEKYQRNNIVSYENAAFEMYIWEL